jgi:predicted kinase
MKVVIEYDTMKHRDPDRYVVFNPNQIHILDSKQDIEGFEKYIFNKSKQSPVEVLDNTEEIEDIAEADNSPVSITPKKEVIQLPKTAQLILPIGISGSGKSTWINSLDKDKYTIISPDMIRKELTGDVSDNSRNLEIFKIVDDRILEALKKGDKVILDATNLNTTFRRLMITNLKSLYPKLDIRYKLLDVDPEIAKQRIANDISNKVDRSKTPDEIIDLQYQQYLQSKLDIKDEPIYEFNNERTAITDLLDRYSKNDNSLRKLTNIAAISGKTQNISNMPIVKDTDNINESIVTMAKYGRTVRELLAIYPSLTEHFKGINLDTKLSDYIKQQEIEKQVIEYVEDVKQDMADNFSDYEDYLSKIDVYTIDDLYNYPNEKLLNDLCINGNLSK